MRQCFFFVGWMVWAVGSAAAQAPFCDQVRALTSGPDVAAAHWGIRVTTLEGAPLCGINDAQLFRPASNNKIFTTATALALLGPDRRFVTRVLAAALPQAGVVHGNLQLIGGGDANFGTRDVPYLPPSARPKNIVPEPGAFAPGSQTVALKPETIADIEELADKIAARGVTAIEGDVLGMDTYFADEPYPPEWSADDLLYGYGAPVSALSIHDNAIEAELTPPVSPGARATLTLTPALPYYKVDNAVDGPGASRDCDSAIHYERPAGTRQVRISGHLPPETPSCSQALAIENPAEYAALALKLALERRGIQVSGLARAQHRDGASGTAPGERSSDSRWQAALSLPDPRLRDDLKQGTPDAEMHLVELARHTSPTLLDDITYTNKVSQNLHAEVLLRNLGALYAGGVTERESLRLVRLYLLRAGVAPQDFVLYDGSGLSSHDLVTPRALAKFLSFVASQPWFESFKATLPVGGVDGSLGTRFRAPESRLTGRVFAKTGSMGESRALSGYLLAASGRTLIFSVLVDDHLPGTAADRTVMDRIVDLIAAAN